MGLDVEAPSDEEFDEFCEVLVGPEGDRIFALHQIYAWRKPGESRWTVDEHNWRVADEWTDYFPSDLDDWRWLDETRRLHGLPHVVERVRSERGIQGEFILAWDVSTAYRVQDAFLESLIPVFDSGATLPANLTSWLMAPIGDVLTRRTLEVSADPRMDVISTPELQVWLEIQSSRPGTAGDSLRSFLVDGRPDTALGIVPDLLRFMRWRHVNGPDRARHG